MDAKQRSERVAEFERVCREAGLPVTFQRRAVFAAVLGREDHPTADRVYEAVHGRMPDVSRTTVYRVLETLVKLGLVVKICHHGSATRFDPRIGQHHHLVCMHCDEIIDFEDEKLNKLALPNVRRHGFEVQDYHIHFRGVCAKCRKAMRK